MRIKKLFTQDIEVDETMTLGKFHASLGLICAVLFAAAYAAANSALPVGAELAAGVAIGWGIAGTYGTRKLHPAYQTPDADAVDVEIIEVGSIAEAFSSEEQTITR